MNSSRYFKNTDCAYFPCHKGVDADAFNCLFCFCPLYALGRDCGGEYRYIQSGVKDCSLCAFPHIGARYDAIVEKCGAIVEMVKQKKD